MSISSERRDSVVYEHVFTEAHCSCDTAFTSLTLSQPSLVGSPYTSLRPSRPAGSRCRPQVCILLILFIVVAMGLTMIAGLVWQLRHQDEQLSTLADIALIEQNCRQQLQTLNINTRGVTEDSDFLFDNEVPYVPGAKATINEARLNECVNQTPSPPRLIVRPFHLVVAGGTLLLVTLLLVTALSQYH